MKKRDKKLLVALKRRRRKSIMRRRKKKVLPVPRLKKNKLIGGGIPQNPERNPEALIAPADFRLLKNTKECINFFKKVRDRKKAVKDKNNRLILKIDLSRIEYIDFASTMMLDAICEELASTAPVCNVYGESPRNEHCRQYLHDSGFLNNKYDSKGRKYSDSDQSLNMKIERGSIRIEDEDIRKAVNIEERITDHLAEGAEKKRCHIDMIKEICGNTVDWSEAMHNQWIYGAKFEKDKVILVALDLGKGILESISRKFPDILKDWLETNSHLEILEGAYNRKYGSKSGRKNRNKGLPSIKRANENGDIKDLVVITNNVLLDFSVPSNSCKFVANKSRGFNGTLYSWVLDASCYN